MFGLTSAELRTLRRLSTPSKIQDFLNTLPFNFERKGETCYSPRMVLTHRTAHCAEGAILAAAALRLNGHRPLIVDMEAADHDASHLIAVYQVRGRWGAISKTNHSVLRFRDPAYASIRELVMSYFHEYTDDVGQKTLRSFTRPLDLSRFDRRGWMTSSDSALYIVERLVEMSHQKILRPGQARLLRPVDPIEKKAGEIVEWRRLRA